MLTVHKSLTWLSTLCTAAIFFSEYFDIVQQNHVELSEQRFKIISLIPSIFQKYQSIKCTEVLGFAVETISFPREYLNFHWKMESQMLHLSGD